ncbi:AaceriAFR739Cp [[Ashbya] aceris (nom. inval.)]|nr:AaceriAFR739Cp [[Ashbya] aceris (nom. inval.)]
MVLSGKRTRSELKGPFSAKKRPCILNDLQSPALPRSTFLLSKSRTSCEAQMRHRDALSSSGHSDLEEAPVRDVTKSGTERASHLGPSPKLDPRLLEAVSRYSDSESVNTRGAVSGRFTSPSTQLERHGSRFNLRHSSPRHSSFSIACSRQRQIPRSDIAARERCFDYILQSIDEVWGRYCNTTSTAENEVYDRLGTSVSGVPAIMSSPNCSFYLPIQPAGMTARTRSEPSDDESDSGYKSEITNPTEYETDCDYRKVSKLPQSMKLQSLKDRLVRAKNDLEGSYDSNSWSDCMYFWRRWDMIKYSAVEMMEEDDDDDVIESVIDELEEGRCYNDA